MVGFKLSSIPVEVNLYSRIGYMPQEVKYVSTKLKERITLKEQVNEFDEVVITGRTAQRKISVVGGYHKCRSCRNSISCCFSK